MRETRRPLPTDVRGSVHVHVHTVPHSHAGAHARVNININLPRAESRDVNQGKLQLQGGRREEGSRTAQDAGQRRGRLSRGPSEEQGGLSCDRSSSAWLDGAPRELAEHRRGLGTFVTRASSLPQPGLSFLPWPGRLILAQTPSTPGHQVVSTCHTFSKNPPFPDPRPKAPKRMSILKRK